MKLPAPEHSGAGSIVWTYCREGRFAMSPEPSPREAWLQQVRTTWDERVQWWDEMSEQNATAPDRATDLDRTIDRLGLNPGDRIYDAGCGSGQFAIAFAERGFQVVASDISPNMIERARQHAQNRSLSVDWRVGDLEDVLQRSERFSAIHARMSLQFVPDIAHALQRFERALAPGGRLYTSVPGATSPIYNGIWRRFLSPDHRGMAYVTPWDLERLLQHFGWEILDQWSGDDLSADVVGGDEASLRINQAMAFTWAIVSSR
jgi:SAM-dependent methyltransferase